MATEESPIEVIHLACSPGLFVARTAPQCDRVSTRVGRGEVEGEEEVGERGRVGLWQDPYGAGGTEANTSLRQFCRALKQVGPTTPKRRRNVSRVAFSARRDSRQICAAEKGGRDGACLTLPL